MIDAAIVYGNLHLVRQVLDKYPRFKVLLKVATLNFKDGNISNVLSQALIDLDMSKDDPRIYAMMHSQFPTAEEDVTAYDTLQRFFTINRPSFSNFDAVRFKKLCDSGRPPAYVEFECNPYAIPRNVLAQCSIYEAIGYRTFGKAGSLLKDPKICEIAERVGWTPAHLLQWWSLQNGVTPIASTTKPDNMEAYLTVVDDRRVFGIGQFPDLKKELDALNNKQFTVMHEWCNVLQTE